jgi:hypothetical protein
MLGSIIKREYFLQYKGVTENYRSYGSGGGLKAEHWHALRLKNSKHRLSYVIRKSVPHCMRRPLRLEDTALKD